MRLTLREKEIVEILKKEPLIAQEELAQRLGIARSSLAVHISNLMKKGVILGRGYVFNERVSGVVFGRSGTEVNVKIGNEDGDGYQARIETRFSGFAYRVSSCLARFGMDVKVLTIMGVDEEGDRLMQTYKNQNVDTAHVYRLAKGRTGKMVRLSGGGSETWYRDDYDLQAFQSLLEARDWLALNCEWLVVEPVFGEMVVRRMAHREEEKRPALCTLHRAGEGTESLPGHLADFFLLVIGVDRESDIEVWSKRSMDLLKKGLENVAVTDGNSRVWVGTRQATVEITLPPNQVFGTGEGLEYFLAGMVYGLSQGYQFRQAVRIGSGTASLAEVSSA